MIGLYLPLLPQLNKCCSRWEETIAGPRVPSLYRQGNVSYLWQDVCPRAQLREGVCVCVPCWGDSTGPRGRLSGGLNMGLVGLVEVCPQSWIKNNAPWRRSSTDGSIVNHCELSDRVSLQTITFKFSTRLHSWSLVWRGTCTTWSETWIQLCTKSWMCCLFYFIFTTLRTSTLITH